MPDSKKTLIMKFGSGLLKEPLSFLEISKLIEARLKHYPRIVIVVSAMRGMTDQLIEMATQIDPEPPNREYDMLVSAGERISIALLAIALAKQGYEAVSFTGSQSGILTCADHGRAKIIDVRPQRILAALEEGKVAIVAGFQGVSQEKEITTLGRGGSDTTAVALGVALRAEKVEFYKDVPGIYPHDPKEGREMKPFKALSFEEALNVVEKSGGQVLHPRALKMAKINTLQLHVRSLGCEREEGTLIGLPSSPLSPVFEK